MKLITLQIDLGRQKETVEYIKSYVDFAAKCGYNSILYYLENAVRTPDTEFLNPDETYTLDEMREIVEYTEAHGLEAIPAFENLGHMEKFLSYPALSHLAECRGDTVGRFYNTDNGDCGCSSNPKFYEFIDKYVTDVASVFRSKYIHMGLDEVFSFAICPDCRARLAAGETKADMFYAHIMHTHALVSRMGRRMMMWDDFFECMDIVDRLPRDIIFTNWNYNTVQDEPLGHWVGRVKRDWFAYYDELGFDYMLCTYAHKSSATYNTDSFNAYAKKYSPMGAIMTTWERASDFYLGAYPHIALAAREWRGEITTKEEQLGLYAEILGNTDCARLLLSLTVPSFVASQGNVALKAENDSFSRRLLREQLSHACTLLRGYMESAVGLAKDIMTDAFVYLYTTYAELELSRVGDMIFDLYQARSVTREQIDELLCNLENGYNLCHALATELWAKYRPGIKSCANLFAKRYKGYFDSIHEIRGTLSSLEKLGVGILYCENMLHDGFCSVRAEIKVRFVGEEEDEIIYTGPFKHAAVCLELGACYTVKLATKPKEIEYIIFAVYGEGALYPLNFRYVVNGKKYVAAAVEKICGSVEHEENVLYNDTRFALLGKDSCTEHFNDMSLSRERHAIKVTLKPLAEYKW